jgi:hypothetical protein
MTQSDAAQDIAEESVLTARADVASVEVDGELVLYDDAAGVLHRLNGAAAALWMCLDGSSTLAEIAVDLADVFDAEPAQVAVDVVEAARSFARAGLLAGVDGMTDQSSETENPTPDTRSVDGASFIAEQPTPCMDPSFTLGSAGMLTVRAGRHLLGLRLSTPELVAAARAVLGAAVVPGIDDPPPNVSVVETSAGVGKPVYFCYRSGRFVTRAASPRRAMRAAATLLSSYDDSAATDSCQIDARVAIRNGEAALLTPESQVVATQLGPRLRAAGWELADTAIADLDPDSGEVVIAAPTVALDPAALAALASQASDGEPPAPGRYPVKVWVSVARTDRLLDSQAARVTAVAASSDSLGRTAASTVIEATRTMLRGASWAVSPSLDAGAIVRTLTAAVDPA